jgi:hypothetical protein
MREHVSKRTSYRPLQFERAVPCRTATRDKRAFAKLSGSWTDIVRDGRAVPIRNARPLPSYILEQVMTEQQLREKLRKITALFEGASTAGERQAAAAAIERLGQALDAAAKTQPLPETKFSMADQWQRRLFLALCRRYGLKPYRRRGQRYTTVMLRAPQSFVDETLWPEFVELQAALHSYLNEATERIIREEVFRDADEAEER